MALIGLIDYGCGNIRSVAQAFEYLGHDVTIHQTAAQIKNSDFLVLPGVGAFEKASKTLRNEGFSDAIFEHTKKGKPFLGICVGMQVLMDTGFEFAQHEGLGLVHGQARSLKDIDSSLQMPHIGWAQIELKENSYFKPYNLDQEYLYFNHSFVCDLADKNDVSAQSKTATPWTIMFEKDNIIGVQCHPEKSHIAGLRFLSAFTEMK